MTDNNLLHTVSPWENMERRHRTYFWKWEVEFIILAITEENADVQYLKYILYIEKAIKMYEKKN